MELTVELVAGALRAGADAADWIDVCKGCGAKSGQQCRTDPDGAMGGVPSRRNHSKRMPGDPVLSFVLRAMADQIEREADRTERKAMDLVA